MLKTYNVSELLDITHCCVVNKCLGMRIFLAQILGIFKPGLVKFIARMCGPGFGAVQREKESMGMIG